MSTSGASRTIAFRSICSGIHGLPQSRLCENDQSSVRMRPLAPASRARSTRRTMESRSPIQYIWKNVCGLAAITSSIGLLANELRPIAVPASPYPRNLMQGGGR